ncbi:MAG: peptidylprolyl isomerase [Rhodothermales bacterium]
MISASIRSSRTDSVLVICTLLAASLAGGCGTSAGTSSGPSEDARDVVARYADEILTLREFERQYSRSTTNIDAATEDSQSAYRDFLERYVNFRLKVRAAEDAGIPAQPDVREEIASYRSRLSRPFLMDKEVIEPITRELYDRQQHLVDVSHILRRIPPGASPADTLAAYREMQAIRDSALQGIDFGELAIRHSDDPSAGGRVGMRGYAGRLGHFTGGNLVEPFETFAYETPLGEISPVFRTQFGYHTLLVHERRPAVPGIHVAHIMLRPGETSADSAQALELLRDIRTQLADGADFAELARQHSQDEQSRPRGGDLGTLEYTSQVPESFRDAAFALENVGDISDVVETPFGFHVIKLTGREELPSYDEAFEELKALADRLPRTSEAERALARRIVRERDGQVDTSRVVEAFTGMEPDSIVARWPNSTSPNSILPDSILADAFFTLADTAFTIRDLVEFADPSSLSNAPNVDAWTRNLVSDFVTRRAVDVEAEHLADRDEAFRRLMREFRDGLVLFEFMEDSVWAVAQEDSAGLRAYYHQRRDAYRWPERTRVVTAHSVSDSVLLEVVRRLDEDASPTDLSSRFTEDSVHAVRWDTTMISDSTYALYDRALSLDAGEHSGVVPYRNAHAVVINDGVEPPRSKTFAEARSTVVNEYQQVVEDRLMTRLRRMYDVQLYPDRLDRAFGPDAEPAGSN